MYSKDKLDNVFKYTDIDAPEYYQNTELVYYSAFNQEMFNLLGTGVKEKNTFYRFPQADIDKISAVSRDVAWLATHSSGIKLRFKTDSRLIRLRVVENDVHGMKNMNHMAQCGFDVYYFNEERNEWVHHNTTFPNYIDEKKYLADLAVFRTKKERELIINFPLYCGVLNLEIGLEEGSICIPTNFKNPGRILVYGTSIIQGGCVSRPGLNVTNVLSRLYEKEVINYGFSGAALMEKIVAETIVNQQVEEPELLIIDAEPNAGCDRWMYDRFDEFIQVFYEKWPNLPIIVMNKTKMTIDEYYPRNKLLKDFYYNFLKNRVKHYKKKGKNIIFVDNYNIFDTEFINYSECTVDGVHPNDLGMSLLTKNYIKAINKISKK